MKQSIQGTKKLKPVEIRVSSDPLGEVAQEALSPNLKSGVVLYFTSFELLHKVLTPERLNLLRFLALHGRVSVNELSKALNRKREAVSRDLRELSLRSLVRLESKGRFVYPRCEFKELKINLLPA
ncbi:MAG TPA: HTH domain-containing protein [archaeon]|nr:HTH domain-containing protein [archaeon]